MTFLEHMIMFMEQLLCLVRKFLVPVLPNYVQTSSIYVDIQTFGANNTPILKGQYGDIEIFENFENLVTIDYPNVNKRTLLKSIDVWVEKLIKTKINPILHL